MGDVSCGRIKGQSIVDARCARAAPRIRILTDQPAKVSIEVGPDVLHREREPVVIAPHEVHAEGVDPTEDHKSRCFRNSLVRPLASAAALAL